MELSLAMKFRITLAAALGIALIGLWAWPLAEPAQPFGAVTADQINAGAKVALILLALATGFFACFLSWPYGKQIAILAAPAGLALWALRGGTVAQMIMLNPQQAERLKLYAQLKWEPVFWLVIVAAGSLGVMIGQIIAPPRAKPATGESESADKPWKPDIFIWVFGALLGPIVREKVAVLNKRLLHRESQKPQQRPGSTFTVLSKAMTALVVSVVIAYICIGIFARDVEVYDSRLGSVTAQPGVGQIAYAVFVSFGAAAFLVKLLLNSSCLWPIVSCAFVTAAATGIHAKPAIVEHLAASWPAVFCSHPAVAILPVQMVAFGTLGSVAGFWSAVRYQYWRKHELK